jgi:hypothetical protein
VGAASATAALICLSVLNAMHGPAYDCVRAGAYFLRSRRGPFVPVMQVENSAERSASIVRTTPVSIFPFKDGIYVCV